MRFVRLCVLALFAPAHAQIFVNDDAGGANDGTSWHDAFVDLQSALAAASGGGEIWVAEGTYRPSRTGDRSASFRIPDGGELYGGFAGTETDLARRAGLFATTVLSGDLGGDDGSGFVRRDDNSLHVLAVVSASTTIDGFTIRGGNASATTGVDGNGGGLRLEFAGAELRHCTFVDNESARGGGAVHAFFSFSLYRECAWIENRTGGGGGALQLELTTWTEASACTFRANVAGADGGAFHAEHGPASFRDCVFVDNRARGSGGAIWSGSIRDGEKLAVLRCRFHANVAGGEGGGAIASGPSGFYWIANCVFTGNVADRCTVGGGALLAGTGWDQGTLASCSIVGNRALGAGIGAGGVLGKPDLRVENSIVWGNVDDGGTGQPAQLASRDGALPAIVAHSCVGGWDGTLGDGWVVSADPRLVDPDGTDDRIGTPDDDLRLRALSPCIDAADATLYQTSWWGELDLDGGPRFVEALACDSPDDVLDIGAHERRTIDGTTHHCPARDSSLGVPAILAAPCAPSVAANDLVIGASPVPPGFGVLVFGEGFARALFGDGVLCVGGPLLVTAPERVIGGALDFALDLAQPPGDAIVAGSSWGFQVLYRDAAAGGAGFNLSDGVRCTFRP